MYRWVHRTKIMEQTHLSHDQLRRIMAEIVDRELLHYIEARRIYITTDQGYIFLKKNNTYF
jgi:predicted transcriptional regulator